MKKLAIICSYNPNKTLLNTINSIKEIYPDFDIAVIDSDSAKLNTYDELPKEVNVHLVKNKNYELGAWKKGYELYPNYDIYMCIQDSIEAVKEVDLNPVPNGTIIAFKWQCGFLNDNDNSGTQLCLPEAKRLLKNTIYEKNKLLKRALKLNIGFPTAVCNFLIINNANLKHLVKTLPNLPQNKEGSRAMERILGIAIEQNKFKWTNVDDGGKWFKKTHLRRS